METLKNDISQELKDRGLVEQEGGGSLSAILSEKRKVYLGIDPTADSLHLGNLVPVFLMKHLADAGHEVVFLVGGGTGMIGDPRESGERVLLDAETVERNTTAIRAQLQNIFGEKNCVIFDNVNWLSGLGIIEFLRDVAKHFTINQLIKRDIIKNRLDAEDPLSFTEFSYSLLQAYDFLHLYKTEGVNMQVGGSDQWANIISGIDLIRRKEGVPSYALTTPIVTDKKSGKKFGKSEGNAVWLDPNKTPPFKFYQFWLNVSDESLETYLNIFTFLPSQDILQILSHHESNPQKRLGQKKLAHEITKIIHGIEAAEAVSHISEIVFGDISLLSTVSKSEIDLLIGGMPGHVLDNHQLKNGVNIIEIMVNSGLVPSKSEGRRLTENKAVYLNDNMVHSVERVLSSNELVQGVAVLRVGKKVILVSEK